MTPQFGAMSSVEQLALHVGRFPVRAAQAADRTELTGNGVLRIAPSELCALVQAEFPALHVSLDLVHPGDPVRIVHALDAIEPRFKPEAGCAFPGWTGPVVPAGEGTVLALDGVAVIVSGRPAGAQPAQVEMSGPGAAYSPFAATINVVLTCEAPGMSPADFDRAVRLLGLRVAERLGRAAAECGRPPAHTETFRLADARTGQAPPAGDLPAAGYVLYVQSQGLLRDTFLYGRSAAQLLPALLHPNEVLDGALVSGNYVIGCQKNPTYLHANNPVVGELYRRHGRELIFRGVIVANEESGFAGKQAVARRVARMAGLLGWGGAVVTKEGGGNADSDLMLACRYLEAMGIRTALITNEVAGQDGASQPLVDFTPEAVAMVSAGNIDAEVDLPPAERAVGAGAGADWQKAMRVPLARLYCATNQFGWGRLRAVSV